MGMSTSRKVALGVLGLAVGALVLDNLPGPRAASAEGAKGQPAQASAGPPTPSAPSGTPTGEARVSTGQQRALAQLMGELRASHAGSSPRDVFASRQVADQSNDVQQVAEGTSEVDPRQELAGVRVTAVAAEGGGAGAGRALVDGRVVRVGDRVRGWQVVGIRLDGVLLRRDDGAEALLGFSAAGRS